MKKKQTPPIPPLEELEAELKRMKYNKRYGSVLRSTVYALIIVAAIAILIAVLVFPVLRIHGSSMTPNLYDGNIVVCLKNSKYEVGDSIAFYYNNKILVKRVIARSGEWVDIDENGYVYVNGEKIEEPYVQDHALGECDIELPYQVPEGRVFVMGDHRSVSVDSRSTSVGCVSDEQIVGRLLFRVWPFKSIGLIK